MLVVTEVLSIDSEKVTEIFSLTETELWLSVGEVEETVGAVVSTTKVFTLNAVELSGCVRIMVTLSFVSSLVADVLELPQLPP